MSFGQIVKMMSSKRTNGAGKLDYSYTDDNDDTMHAFSEYADIHNTGGLPYGLTKTELIAYAKELLNIDIPKNTSLPTIVARIYIEQSGEPYVPRQYTVAAPKVDTPDS